MLVMRKGLLMLMFKVLVFVPMVTMSQTGNLNVGVYLGGGISNTNSFLTPGFAKTGGISLGYKLDNNLTIISGIAYQYIEVRDFINAIDSLGEQMFNLEIKHKYEFVTIPVMLRYSFGKNDKFKYFVNAGTYAAFLLNQNLWSLDLENNSINQLSNIESYRRMGAGIAFGGGLSFALSDGLNLDIEIANNLGITNLRKTLISKQKTKSSQLTIGLSYKL